MCSHVYFYRGNEKQTVRLWRTLILYHDEYHIHLKYRLSLVYRTEYWTSLFLGGGGGSAYLKRGAYSKFKAFEGALTWSWALIRAVTVILKPLERYCFEIWDSGD